MSASTSSNPPREVRIDLLDPSFGRPVKSWTFRDKTLIKIGRADDQDVEINDAYVSRNHANLAFAGNQWTLVSLGRNGVVIDGQAIKEVPVQSEVKFKLGPAGPALFFQTTVGEAANMQTICFETSPLPVFQLDETKLQDDVGAIAQGDYFQSLQQKAKTLRQRRNPS